MKFTTVKAPFVVLLDVIKSTQKKVLCHWRCTIRESNRVKNRVFPKIIQTLFIPLYRTLLLYSKLSPSLPARPKSQSIAVNTSAPFTCKCRKVSVQYTAVCAIPSKCRKVSVQYTAVRAIPSVCSRRPTEAPFQTALLAPHLKGILYRLYKSELCLAKCKTLYLVGLFSVVFSTNFTTVHFNPLNPEINPICYLLALLGAHHFLHVSRVRVKLLTFKLLMSYIYGAPILDVSRSHTTTQHSR